MARLLWEVLFRAPTLSRWPSLKLAREKKAKLDILAMALLPVASVVLDTSLSFLDLWLSHLQKELTLLTLGVHCESQMGSHTPWGHVECEWILVGAWGRRWLGVMWAAWAVPKLLGPLAL